MTTTVDERLNALRSQGTSAALCARLEGLVREGAPTLLARMAPPRLALQWGLPEHEVLDAFLRGTRVWKHEIFGAKLKGIRGSYPVVRLLPPGASTAAAAAPS